MFLIFIYKKSRVAHPCHNHFIKEAFKTFQIIFLKKSGLPPLSNKKTLKENKTCYRYRKSTMSAGEYGYRRRFPSLRTTPSHCPLATSSCNTVSILSTWSPSPSTWARSSSTWSRRQSPVSSCNSWCYRATSPPTSRSTRPSPCVSLRRTTSPRRASSVQLHLDRLDHYQQGEQPDHGLVHLDISVDIDADYHGVYKLLHQLHLPVDRLEHHLVLHGQTVDFPTTSCAS